MPYCHRALHSEMKVLSHPGRPCWVRVTICTLGGMEAIALRLVEPEAARTACTICQGSYLPGAPGKVDITFHLDCGNGCAPPQRTALSLGGPNCWPLTARASTIIGAATETSSACLRICTACETLLSEKYEGDDVAPCPWCMEPMRHVRRGVWPGQVM